jgi:hypothetical protein
MSESAQHDRLNLVSITGKAITEGNITRNILEMDFAET